MNSLMALEMGEVQNRVSLGAMGEMPLVGPWGVQVDPNSYANLPTSARKAETKKACQDRYPGDTKKVTACTKDTHAVEMEIVKRREKGDTEFSVADAIAALGLKKFPGPDKPKNEQKPGEAFEEMQRRITCGERGGQWRAVDKTCQPKPAWWKGSMFPIAVTAALGGLLMITMFSSRRRRY